MNPNWAIKSKYVPPPPPTVTPQQIKRADTAVPNAVSIASLSAKATPESTHATVPVFVPDTVKNALKVSRLNSSLKMMRYLMKPSLSFMIRLVNWVSFML